MADFPSMMKVYIQKNDQSHIGISLCDGSPDKCIAFVQKHAGYDSTPLGMAAGITLHMGTNKKGAIIAAAGSTSFNSSPLYMFNANSIIVIPRLGCEEKRVTTPTVREEMRAATSPVYGVVFRFSIEVGDDDDIRRERVEWRRLEKAPDFDSKYGFQLVRLEARKAASASADKDGETVALLSIDRFLSKNPHRCTIRLMGSAESGEVGYRCKLMIVITALRVYRLVMEGKGGKKYVKISETLRGGAE
ncbi:hypothetical protein N7474_000760 [Penicillium riverlandense]|uniref:uncharacterized protein n=1 Tax=Penicillium riverlandense TaxID=1903569 RepID=UPI0025478E91|nr:uncharacterized protein N7474_000760 [Penicillium riverlandense]KAJ5832449.1 hypothetical protein N7474_000760 [Penicillium riverlandense]